MTVEPCVSVTSNTLNICNPICGRIDKDGIEIDLLNLTESTVVQRSSHMCNTFGNVEERQLLMKNVNKQHGLCLVVQKEGLDQARLLNKRNHNLASAFVSRNVATGKRLF